MAESTAPAQVAVVGAGLMGHAIAKVFLDAGSTVRIWDAVEDARESAGQRILTLSPQSSSTDFARLHVTATLAEAVEGAELIVEAIVEDLAAKQELLRSLDSLAPAAVIATNTSVLRISEIAAGSATPGRVVGAHWWNPPHLIAVVEVTPGDLTAPETVEAVVAWLRAAGKTPVMVNVDAPGFIGNRMQFALWREAFSIVERGICDAETVDLVVRETFGRRLAAIGPVENADLIGLELTRAIMSYVLPDLSTEQEPPSMIVEAIRAGRTGAVAGSGMLTWHEGDLERTRQRLAAHLGES